MLTKKILSIALAGILMVGGTSITAFATETTVPTLPSGQTIQEFLESGKTLEGLKNIKAQLEEKGLTLEDAKANFESKFNDFATANGLTIEEAKAKIQEIKGSGKTLEGLNNMKAQLEEKGITLEEAKLNFGEKFNAFIENNELTAEEAKDKITEMKNNGKTFEGLKNFKENKSNFPTI